MRRCDLHRHLGGSISVSTVAKLSGLTEEYVIENMTYGSDEAPDYKNFLNKFNLLNTIQWDEESISLTVLDIIKGLKSEHIDYSEIKFSVGKYLKYLNCSVADAIICVANMFHEYAKLYNIEVGLTLALQYESDREMQIEAAKSILNDRVAELVSSIDLVGNEEYFDVDFYRPLYDMWHDAGKICIAHVGELPIIDNVMSAIDILKVDRICHGIAAADNLVVANKARERGIAFDIGITSNLRTGVADMDHPVKMMLDNGFIITIGTDDPAILNTTLDKEYKLFKEITGCSFSILDKIYQNSDTYSCSALLNRAQR